jgi:hypothetical protein
MEPPMNAQDDLARLEKETANVRTNLTWDPKQLPEIHKLYFRYVELGRPFPADLEEHSLWLILKFIRPDDDSAAGRLVTVLEEQGKPVPDDLKSLVTRDFAVSYEEIAFHRRSKVASTTEPDSPLHKRLFFVVGLPKSASRLMVSVLAAMHPIERFRRPARLPYATGYTGIDLTADLRYDSLIGCTEGGIVHSHLNPTNVTRHALAHLALGHVISIRHPADHIAALYCHIRRITKLPMLDDSITARLADEPLPDPASSLDTYERSDGPNRLFLHDVIFPVDVRFFARSVSVDDTIAHMIACGYLYYALNWIVSWQLLRIRNFSIIVRYEDFIGNPEATLRRVNDVLFPGNSDDAVAAGCKVFGDKNYDTDVDPDIYPRGSTGAKGIWRNYFSPENRGLYNSVCQQFLAAHPYGPMLKHLYPDLLAN